jgi:hypothetical protein
LIDAFIKDHAGEYMSLTEGSDIAILLSSMPALVRNKRFILHKD